MINVFVLSNCDTNVKFIFELSVRIGQSFTSPSRRSRLARTGNAPESFGSELKKLAESIGRTEYFSNFAIDDDNNHHKRNRINMEKLIVIDACMRDEASRTKKILNPIVVELGKKYEIETITLDGDDYRAVGRKVLAERCHGYVPEEIVEQAKRIAAADRIVIAAPFWDMSFPAILKVFIESMSLFNIMFKDCGTHFEGLCKCKKLLYVTTRGMNVHTDDALDAATPYFRALSALWGLGDVITVASENMDFGTPKEIDEKIDAAIAQGLKICQDF